MGKGVSEMTKMHTFPGDEFISAGQGSEDFSSYQKREDEGEHAGLIPAHGMVRIVYRC